MPSPSAYTCKLSTVKPITDYNPSNIFACAQSIETPHMTEYSPPKTKEYPSDIPQFSKPCVLQMICQG